MDILPPEWAPQSGVMLTWPHRETIWAERLDVIDRVFVEVIQQITPRQKVLINCFDEAHQHHIKTLLDAAHINLNQVMTYRVPSDDIWVRDHGPLCVLREQQPVLLDFIFNGWGNKYPAAQDNQLTRHLHAQNAFGNVLLNTIDMVLEGGAIEVDGQGTLLTTRRCLLAKTRNPTFTENEIVERLQKFFGIKKILWLDYGYLAGDDTDSHIDTLARFIDPQTICYVRCTDPADEHFAELQEMENQLHSFRNQQGQPYQLVPLPWPKAQYAIYDGRRLPATYANFLIINDAVLVPTYHDPADTEALNILTNCFPQRQVIGMDCSPVIQWYGSLHCMTMQLPEKILL